LKPKTLCRNFGDVIECPHPYNSDTIRCHVRKSLVNVGIGIEEGKPVSIGSYEAKRAAIKDQATTGRGDKRGRRRPSRGSLGR
jgi:hypothetical protein